MSSSLNIDFEHNCTGKHDPPPLIKINAKLYGKNVVMLYDNDGNVLDSKSISFKTTEGCIYCPDGVCECQVNIIFSSIHPYNI